MAPFPQLRGLHLSKLLMLQEDWAGRCQWRLEYVASMDPTMLIFARILLGIGLGFSIQETLLVKIIDKTVSEMAPYKYRGSLNLPFPLSITNGILVTNIVYYFTNKIKDHWEQRISLGGAAFPAFFFAVSALSFLTLLSPYLDPEQAHQLLCRVLDDLKAAADASQRVTHPWKIVAMRKSRPQLTMSIPITFSPQLTGINIVIFFAPLLFKSIGSGVMFSSLSNLIFMNFVDRVGRRGLFLQGVTPMLFSQ
ncbi:LOW QUALITY PROTEIN: Major facilitator, sugar transporter-like, partial [Dillenia turbinata]